MLANYVHGERRAYHFPRYIILLEMPAEEAMLNALKPNQVPYLGFNHIVSKKLKTSSQVVLEIHIIRCYLPALNRASDKTTNIGVDSKPANYQLSITFM